MNSFAASAQGRHTDLPVQFGIARLVYTTNILVRLLTVKMKSCLTPKNPKMCDPIVATLLKMRPHSIQS